MLRHGRILRLRATTSTTSPPPSENSNSSPPSARPADWLIIADGFSCREQIAQGTGRHALHLAEVLQMALQPSALDIDDPYPESAPVREHRSRSQRLHEARRPRPGSPSRRPPPPLARNPQKLSRNAIPMSALRSRACQCQLRRFLAQSLLAVTICAYPPPPSFLGQ